MYSITETSRNKRVWSKGIVLMGIGTLLSYFGCVIISSWFNAVMPEPRNVYLYVTPLANVVVGEYFNSGFPSVRVSMEEFKEKSRGEPYIVSFSPKWVNKKTSGDRNEDTIWYLIKKPGTDIYYVSSETAPQFSDGIYRMKAAFDPQRKAFFPVFYDISYDYLSLGIIVFLIGFGFVVGTTIYLYYQTFLYLWLSPLMARIMRRFRI